MVEGLALSAGIILLMILMSAWTASQLPDGPVPVHFDIRGRADKFGSRWVALATLPVCYIFLAAFLAWIGFRTPPEEQADQLVGQSVAGVAILGAHAFIIWLLLRWATARQP